jgi:hypothetical protein
MAAGESGFRFPAGREPIRSGRARPFGRRDSVVFSSTTMNMTRRNMVLSTVSALGATLLPTAADQLSPAAHEGNAGVLSDLASLDDFERAARERMVAMAYEFVASGAGDEVTIRWNPEDL